MDEEISLMYPDIIVYSLIVMCIILIIWKKSKKRKNGVIVANTKYVKRTGYFKKINTKYHIYSIIIRAVCIILVLLYAVLSSRPYLTKKHSEEYNNRDIMLCLDLSESMNEFNPDLIETMKKTVESLKDERFGITVFDSTPLTIVPLTTDYNYALYYLNLIQEFYGNYYDSALVNECFLGGTKPKESFEVVCGKGREILPGVYYTDEEIKSCVDKKIQRCYNEKTHAGMVIRSGTNGKSGSSAIGDGIASCSMSFNDDDRTKIVILSTDNKVTMQQSITVPEATTYSKDKGIKVYPIMPSNYKKNDLSNDEKLSRDLLINLANETDGKYYYYGDDTTDQISQNIEELNKSAIVKDSYILKKDLPELVFPYILFLVPALLLLDWRVRI